MTLYNSKNKRWEEHTGTPEKYPQGYFKPKPCGLCATTFTPKSPSNRYCSQYCSDHSITSAYLKRTYGISYDQYLEMLHEQGHVCKLCSGEGFLMSGHHKLKLVVDHCHRTGKVRGLLCHNCNRALGLLHDDPATILAAFEYLKV